MLFDTHAHFDAEQFDPDRDELLSSMPEQGVGYILNPGCNLRMSRAAVDLAHKYPFIYAAVGYHPEDCGDMTDEDLQEIFRLAQDPRVKAIGEIGLDYYWEQNPPKERQQEVFRRQMEMARQLKLPVIIHDREAHADSLAIVKEFPDVMGVFHCYSGSAEMAKEILDMGWMLSFTGVITYKNARKSVEVVEMAPLERLMVETDAPYMAPVPHRGQRNHSGFVHLMAEKIAEIKGLPVEEVIRTTTENGKRFFRIED